MDTTKYAMFATLAAAALLSASPAHADDPDDAFLKALMNAGIQVSDTGSAAAIAKAESICTQLDQGVPAAQLAKGTNPQQRAAFVNISVRYYCPQHMKDLG